MPLYHFDLWERDRFVIDDCGLDLPDLETAKRRAIDALGDAVRDFVIEGVQDCVAIEIRDDDKSIMTISAVLRIELGG